MMMMTAVATTTTMTILVFFCKPFEQILQDQKMNSMFLFLLVLCFQKKSRVLQALKAVM